MLNYETYTDEQGARSDKTESGKSIRLNPFPGLRPFSINEYHLFFGREDQVDEVLLKLQANRFVTVMGYSGSGKSSLMYCGLVPTLHGGFLDGTSPSWTVVISRPGSSPIENLAESILKVNQQDQTDEQKATDRKILSTFLKTHPEKFISSLEKLKDDSGDGNILILIDQFEELFRFSKIDDDTTEEAKLYVNLLLDACKNENSNIYLAITMRSDYVGDCSKFPGLTQLINQSNYLVPQMSREQKKLAIEGPVAVGGGEISERLVKRLLSEVGDNQDQLPILQHALMRTWEYWVRTRDENEPIDIRHYNSIGRISQALSQHANETYDELSEKEKQIAEVLFKSLTQRTNNVFGMRRQVRVAQVSELGNVSDDEVIEVIEKFRRPGRSFLVPQAGVPLTSDSVIEIAHESLMRIWNRLRAWVDEEFESAQMYRRISEAAAMYQVGRTGLWRPPDLQLALNWQKKQRPTRVWAQRYDEAFERAIVFLDTSRLTYEAEQKNRQMLQKRLFRRTKIVAVILGIAVLISVMFLVFAVTQNIEANKQRLIALEQGKKAQRESEDAKAYAKEAGEQRRIAKEQEKIAREQAEKARKALLVAQAERRRAEAQSRIAEQQRNIADKEKIVAQELRIKAEIEYQRAELNYHRAQKLLYQSIAQSMAVKSLGIEDSNLKGLLAQQAYVFNRDYEGRTYDPYIYTALNDALTQINGKSYNTISRMHRNAVRSIVFENDGSTFYTTGTQGKIVSSSTSNLKNNRIMASMNYPSRVLKISDDNRWLVNGSDSSDIKVFDLHHPEKETLEIAGHFSFINDVHFLPDQHVFLSVGGDRQLRRNYIESGRSELIKLTDEEWIVISVSKDGKLLAAGSRSGRAILMNLEDFSEQVVLSEEKNPVHALAFSPDDKFLAIGDEQGTVKIYNLKTGTMTHEFSGQKGRISALDYSADGKLLAAASLDKSIYMWVTDEIDELPIKMTNNDSYIWDIAFSPDSRYIVAACNSGNIKLWPTRPEMMADVMCERLSRNMTEEEWKVFVGHDIDYNVTCCGTLIN